MKFRTSDGDTLVGRSYDDIVKAMADQKFTKPRSLAAYRKQVARRVAMLFGQSVDTGDNKVFVESLESHGLLERA